MNYVKLTDAAINDLSYSDLYHNIEEVSERSLGELSREEILGKELCFTDIIPAIAESRRFILRASPTLLGQVFKSKLKGFQTTAKRWLILVKKIGEFKSTQENAASTRNGIFTEAESLRQKIIDDTVSIIAYTNTLKREQVDSEYEESRHRLMKHAEQTSQKIDGLAKQAEVAAIAAQVAAGQSGVSAQSEFFKEQADTHSSVAKVWLGATFVMGISLLASIFLFESIFGYSFGDLTSVPGNVQPVIVYLSTKIVFIASIVFFIALCRRSYIANRHNEIINRQRANALKTYEAIIAATDSDEARDIVLQQAAFCIFSHQDTSLGRNLNTNDVSLPQVVLNAPAGS